MEDKGQVSRTRSERDNRVVLVELTEAGRRLARETPLGGLPLLRRRLAALSPERLAQVDGVLAELMELMEVAEIE
jgi:DNA-binding MarR family transcriptional regulator